MSAEREPGALTTAAGQSEPEPSRFAAERHFTVTGFLVHDERTLLIWHRKIRMWLPPGGHIEPNEEPEEAVLREILEETGMAARIVPEAAPHSFDVPHQVPRPEAILLEDIDEPGRPHQHIDLIYFCEPVPGAAEGAPDGVAVWVDEAELLHEALLEYEPHAYAAIPTDVCDLGLAALERVGRRPVES